ncbi:MAG: HEAT repeat domain-containing protein [Planctomycetota bacterium]
MHRRDEGFTVEDMMPLESILAEMDELGAEMAQKEVLKRRILRKAQKKSTTRFDKAELLPLGLIGVVAIVFGVLLFQQGGEAEEEARPSRVNAKLSAIAELSDDEDLREIERWSMEQVAMGSFARVSFSAPADRARAVAAFKAQKLQTSEDLLLEVQSNRQGLRGPAAYLLASLGDDEEQNVVARVFLSSKDKPGGLLALAAAELRDPDLAEAITPLYRSEDPIEREAAAMALRDHPEPAADVLLRLYADPDRRVRRAAARTLAELEGMLKSAAFHAAVDEALSSESEAKRMAALSLCYQMRSLEATDMLAQAMLDESAAVRAKALDCLARLGGPTARSAMLNIVWEGTPFERLRALEGLERVGLDDMAATSLTRAEHELDDRRLTAGIARLLVLSNDTRGIKLAIRLHADADLRDGADRAVWEQARTILEAVSAQSRPRDDESYHWWWRRVESNYEFPSRMRIDS